MRVQPSNPPSAATKPRRVLVFGCGYLGSRVARLAAEAGHETWGSSRSERKGQELRNLGIQPVIADWTDRRTLSDLPEVDQVVISVSYDPRGSADRMDAQVGGLRNLLEVLPRETSICYFSTTGVYHQSEGCWVDEASTTRPNRPGAVAHLLGEALFRRLRPDSAWTVLRLAGIYGPGRIPRLADVRVGRPIASAGSGYLNLIHVDDAAAATLATCPDTPERLYVVADDRPVLRSEYYGYIARVCGAPKPTFFEPGPDASARMRSESNKRIWNRRMKRDLVPTLKYPSFREGLRGLL